MAALPPDATAADLRKMLREVQLAYTRIQQDLNGLRAEHNKLQNQLAPRTRAHALKVAQSGPLDTAIISIAKKYALLYHLWVPSGIFPLREYPADFDFNHPRRYRDNTTRTTAYAAEIYLMLPVALQNQAMKYEQFKPVFSSAVNTECANILKPLKDSAALLFTHLMPTLDPAALGDWRKCTDNPAFLSLLKQNPKNPDDQFTPLAPILFQDPDQMDAQGLFKNTVLTQMACVLFDRKGVLTGKQHGGPPERGRKLGATTITEGMIAACCTFACYLLSGDDEFSPPTHKEWSLGLLAHFNDVVFGADQQASVTSINNTDDTNNPVGGQTKSWEDDIMDQLGGSGIDNGANANLSPPNPFSTLVPLSSTHPTQLAVDPRSAQPAVNPNLAYQPTIAMNSCLGISTAQAPMDMPSISGSGNIWTPAHAISGPVPVQNTLDIHVPLANLLLANGQSSQPLGESVSAAMNIDTNPANIAP
ncbi:hypothetical protein OG21DRAFT_1491096 [Imleria badia]|nr:hypothetical protein OG21DRAFT_1491096 [Imleria badia]